MADITLRDRAYDEPPPAKCTEPRTLTPNNPASKPGHDGLARRVLPMEFRAGRIVALQLEELCLPLPYCGTFSSGLLLLLLE